MAVSSNDKTLEFLCAKVAVEGGGGGVIQGDSIILY